MKYVILVCLILQLVLAGAYVGSAGSTGSNGPYGANRYAGHGFSGKSQRDKIANAKYHKDRINTKNLYNAAKKNRANAEAFNLKRADQRAKDNSVKAHVNRHNKAAMINARKNRVRFDKANAAKKNRLNRVRARNNHADHALKAGNNLNKNQFNKKNANIKKVNNFAKHSEFDDMVDGDAGYGVSGYGSKAGYGKGPMHKSARKHGQQHSFGQNLFKSNYGSLNNANLHKNSFMNQRKKLGKHDLDKLSKANAARANKIGYDAASNKYNKKNHLNSFNAAVAKKNRAAAKRMLAKNAKKRNHSNAAAVNKLNKYNKARAAGAATRGAHAYKNNYARNKKLGNHLV